MILFKVTRNRISKSSRLIILVVASLGMVLLFKSATLDENMGQNRPNEHGFAYKHKDTDGKKSVDDDKSRDQCPRTASSKRMNVILFGHGRSGTSFLGQLFNQNPSVFYHFEPLNFVRSMSKEKIVMDYRTKQSQEYIKNVFEVLSTIFSCEFSESNITSDFLSYYSKSTFQREQSEALKKYKASSHLDIKTMNALCRSLPSYTFVKLLIPRLPDGQIANLLPLIRKLNQSQFKLIHVIRDPRGVLNSQMSLGWSPGISLEIAARTMCRQTQLNLAVEKVRDVLFQCNYKRITYEDLVTKPLTVAKELYSFLGMKSSLAVRRWIDGVTNLSREDLKKGKGWQFSQIRNTTLVMAKWKSASRKRNRIIERECADVMDTIGYKKLARTEVLPVKRPIAQTTNMTRALQGCNHAGRCRARPPGTNSKRPALAVIL